MLESSRMYKIVLEIVAGFVALVVGIFAAKNGVTIEGLGRGILTIVGVHATRSETIACLFFGLASVLLSLPLRGWLKIHGYPKWKMIVWTLVPSAVVLLGSCSIMGWPSPSEVATLSSKDIKGQMLAGARLRKANLHGANLHVAMLAGADLRGSDLESADLGYAMLLGANLRDANLKNANFEGAMLLGAQMEGAQIEGVNFKNAAFLTQDQVNEACGKPKVLPEGLRMPKLC